MNYVFPLIATLIWGGNAIVTKLSASVIAPAEIGFYRWFAAVLLLLPFVAPGLYANRDLVRRQIWRLAVLGILGGAVFQCLAYMAAQFTSALNIGIIQALMPLFSIGLITALLGHRTTYGAILGAAISLAGVAVVVSRGSPATLLAQGPNRGDAMMLVATMSYAAYSVLLKRWEIRLPLPQSLCVQAVVASAALLPLYLISDRHGLHADNVPLVLYAAVLASVVAPLVWMHGINRIGPARMSLFFNLVPVFSTCLAITLLGEQPTISLIAGGGLTMGGVLLAELWRAPLRNPIAKSAVRPET